MITPGAPSSAQLPRPGDIIAGKYVLDRLLGQGGMGAVFAARHVKLSKPVAIKIMLADTSNPEASARFLNEGRAAANIQNEHVVRVDDVDEEMGYAYMVLELLEGEDLSQVLEREPQKRLPPHVAVDYVLQALRGVIQAHAIGIVHRDLKPSNLFLAKRKDGSVVVKVLDFGISKQQSSSALAASPSALTSTKAMLGSPLYMSPEQLRSSKSVDQRADIWAFGVILYELITGSLPFMGESLGELFAAILETDPMPLHMRVEGVPPGLEEIVLRCLARRPEDRFQTASELAAALAPYAVAQGGVAVTRAMGPRPQSHTANPSTSNPVVDARMTPPGATMSASSHAHTGSQPRPVGGTVALGAATPQNFQQTNGGWQSTGNASTAVATNTKAPLVVGLIAALLAVVGVIGVVFVVYVSKRTATAAPSTGSSAAVSATAPPAPTIISSAPAIPTAPSPSSDSAPAASSSATAPSVTATAPPATSTAATVAKTTTPTARPTHGGHHQQPPIPTTTASTRPVETKPSQPKPPRTADPTQTTR